jgi:uncharacterized membrane protein HdeD (DUF308 family)
MEERTKELLRKNAPWRRGIPWPVVAVEGAAILAIGLFMLLSPDNARDIVRQLLAAVLVIHSVIVLVAVFRSPVNGMQRLQIMRSTIGLTVGTIVSLAPISEYLADSSSRMILGGGLVAHAVIGLGSMAQRRSEGRRLLGEAMTVGLTTIIGVTLLVNTGSDSTRTMILGALVTVAGALLAAYAAWLRRSTTVTPAMPATGATV